MRRLLWLVTLLVIIVSCGKNDAPAPTPPQFQTDKTALNINGVAGDKDSVSLQAGVSWSATVSPTTATWLSLSTSNGSGNQKIIVSARENNLTGSSRTATITIAPSGNTALQPISISVSQSSQQLELRADSTVLNLGAQKDATDSFTIQSNLAWTITVSPTTTAWLKTNVTSGNGTTKVCVTTLEENTGTASRSAVLTISATGTVSPVSLTVHQQFSPGWIKVFSGSTEDYFSALVRTPDNGYMAGGRTASAEGDFSSHHGALDAWVVKVDGSGNKLWQKSFGGSGYESISGMVAMADGGCLFTGTTNSNDQHVSGFKGVNDVWVVRLNGSGDIVWQKTFGGSWAERANAIVPSIDGHYFIAATTMSDDGDVATGTRGNNDFWVLKIDGNGNKLWDKRIDKLYDDIAYGLAVDADGGCIISGSAEVFVSTGNGGGYSHSDALIVKLDGSGRELWRKTLGGGENESAQAVALTKDGGYMITGYTASSDGEMTASHGSSDVWLAKLDAQGNKLWMKLYGGRQSDGAYAIAADANGYVLTGQSSSTDGDATSNQGAYDIWVLKVDENGTKMWQESIGGLVNDNGYGVLANADGSVVIAGRTEGKIPGIISTSTYSDGILIRLKR